MTAPTFRSCISTGLVVFALAAFHGAMAQPADPGLEAAGKCATTSGTATGACGTTRKGILDFLAATPEDKAWAAGTSCNSGGAGDTPKNKFSEIRRQANQWGKNPGSPERIASLAKVTNTESSMCMLNAIVGPKNCEAFLVAQRDGFHRNDVAGDPTKSWKAMFCK
ncbi:MAG TPA: hypothetical protein VFX89_01395 [Gammaproteobacteria bacterium]|nr:hypothetical protein [Gammaproteobacteria bacterium]